VAKPRPTQSPPTLPDPIHRFVEEVNRGDTESFLAFFPEHGAVDDEGRRFIAHEAIRRWSDREFIAAKGRMTVTRVTQTNNGASFNADWKSNYYSGASRFAFVLDGDRIRELRVTGA